MWRWPGLTLRPGPPNLLECEAAAGAANPKPSAQEMARFLQKLPTGGWYECEVKTLKPKMGLALLTLNPQRRRWRCSCRSCRQALGASARWRP